MLERSFGLLFFLKQAKNHKGAVKPVIDICLFIL